MDGALTLNGGAGTDRLGRDVLQERRDARIRHLLNPVRLAVTARLAPSLAPVAAAAAIARRARASAAALSPRPSMHALDAARDKVRRRLTIERALELARAARFQPLRGRSPALTVGVLIFEWRAVPQTNAPAINP